MNYEEIYANIILLPVTLFSSCTKEALYDIGKNDWIQIKFFSIILNRKMYLRAFLSDVQTHRNDISTFSYSLARHRRKSIAETLGGSEKAANESQETRGKKMSERNSKKTGWEYRTVWQGALRAASLITGAIEAPAYLAARGASRNRDAPPVFAAHLTRERNGGTISRACKNVRTVHVAVTPTYRVFRGLRNLDRCAEMIVSR